MIEFGIWTSVLLGVAQGLTEFLPISSSGHLILLREFLGIGAADFDLTFDALLHFSTALAIVVYFWRDIANLLQALPRLLRRLLPTSSLPRVTLGRDEVLLVALALGTVPAVVFGLLLEDIMATLFRNPLLVVASLTIGSLVMVYAERTYRKRKTKKEEISVRSGLHVGLFQTLALIPGMSRSGMAISGGMFLGLTREYAARFAFLLGAPLLLGAGTKKALELGEAAFTLSVVLGVATAFFVALVVIHVLLRFLARYTLHVFVAYRLALAAAVLFILI